MNGRRRVEVSKVVYIPDTDPDYAKGKRTRVVQVGEATFAGYGLDMLEQESYCTSFTVAIVEYDDGKVSLVPVHLIRFI